MRLSRYIQTREVEPGVMGAYHPFGHEVTFLGADDWSALVANGDRAPLPRAVVCDLLERNFLVHEGFEEAALGACQPPRPRLAEMWLILVQSCNMACRYCVIEGNVKEVQRRAFAKSSTPEDRRADVMSIELAEAACQAYERLLQRSRPAYPRVTIYGGEPLLNKAALRHVLPRLRAISFPDQTRPEPVQILVITNGQIYDEKLVEEFLRYRVSVSVSLDGMRQHHDRARINLAGNGTYDRATESLRRYKAAGLNVGICTTIGTHNYADLPEIADFFADELGVPFELQIPFDVRYGDGAGNPFYVEMAEAAPKAMEAYRRLRARGMIEGLAARRLMQMARGIFHHRDCSAVGGQFVVAPDGAVGPCHSMVGERGDFAGDIRDPDLDPDRMPAFQKWHQRQPVNMPECHGCSAIGICGGGCPYNALIRSGSIWNKDPQQCGYMHYLIDWFIDDCWQRYKQATTRIEPSALAQLV
jgi:uncharacterized protein